MSNVASQTVPEAPESLEAASSTVASRPRARTEAGSGADGERHDHSSDVGQPAVAPAGHKLFSVKPGPISMPDRRQRRIFVTLVIIAVLIGLYTIYFARTILMPIVAGAILALLFRPVVRHLRRYHIPDSVGAGLVLASVVLVVFGFFANLIGPAQEWLNDAPANLRIVGKKLNVVRDQVENLNRASAMVEKMARGDAAPEESPDAPFPFAPEPSESESATSNNSDPGELTAPLDRAAKDVEPIPVAADEPITVEVRQPRLLAGLTVLSSTGTVAAGILLALVLAYFLLASGDMLINNVLHILPSMREKRNAVELVHNVEHGISSYLLTVTLINIGLGTAIALAMWLLGLPNPVLWGAMATVFNFVPFLGAICGTIVVFLVAVLTFDSLGQAIIPPLVFWAITAIEGNFITPHILGRRMSLNPIMVFLALAIWGWMWGIGGAFLAVPILATLKVGFDQFDSTRPIGTLLGGDLNG